MKKNKINAGELITYIITLLFWLGGLTMITLHIVGMNLERIDNPLRNANAAFAETMKMNFLVFGTLLIIFGSIVAVIALSVNGAKAEVIAEKKARRQQRLALEDTIELE